jgi:hypothetical protein
MPELKVGSRVRAKLGGCPYFDAGDTGTVLELPSSPDGSVLVLFDPSPTVQGSLTGNTDWFTGINNLEVIP